MQPVVQMIGITKRFPAILANDSIDFDLMEGETHALVGENGAGKTTLMRILYGQYAADEGKIIIGGTERSYNIAGALALGIGMVHQNFMQIPEMTIVENIILGHAPKKWSFIDYRAAKERVRGLLQRFGMKASPDALIRTLCVGERQKIEIIKALYLGARVLILDEPTAVLTPQETDELFAIIGELKRDGTSVVFISHKLREVIAVADRITVMRKGKAAARFQRGEADETGIARAMVGRQDVALIQNTKETAPGEQALAVRNLWCFDENGLAKVRGLSFAIHRGEILGVGGVEGNGQSELIELLTGMLPASSGEIVLEGKGITRESIRARRALGLGYIPEDRMSTGLALEGDIDDNLICGSERQFSRFGFLRRGAIAGNTREKTKSFDIRGAGPKKPVKTLSGGNMQKIVLAREIGRAPKVLIAAQPTRGLDIGAINFVRQHLLEQKRRGTAILLVSADLEELMSLSDRIIILYEGGCSGEVRDIGAVTEAEIGLMMGGVKRGEEKPCKP